MAEPEIKNILKLIGKRMQIRRILMDLNQIQLAELVGVSQAMIGQIENGKRKPSLEVLLKIAAAIKLTPEQLLSPLPPVLAELKRGEP